MVFTLLASGIGEGLQDRSQADKAESCEILLPVAQEDSPQLQFEALENLGVLLLGRKNDASFRRSEPDPRVHPHGQ